MKRNIMASVVDADSATSAEPRTIQADVWSGSERDQSSQRHIADPDFEDEVVSTALRGVRRLTQRPWEHWARPHGTHEPRLGAHELSQLELMAAERADE